MHDFLHAHPWIFYVASALIIFTAYWRGRRDERRDRARKEQEEINIPVRYTPSWLYTDRQLH